MMKSFKLYYILLALCILQGALLQAQNKVLYNHSLENPFAGYEEAVASAIENFKSESGWNVQVVTSYRHSGSQFSSYAQEWLQNSSNSGFLIALNPETDSWESGLQVVYSNNVVSGEDFSPEGVQNVIDHVMIPILEEESVMIVNDLGQIENQSYGASIKFYKCIEIGLRELMRNGGDSSGGDFYVDADVTFGPLSVKFAETPQSSRQEGAYCFFEDIEASFLLTLLGQEELSKQVTVENAYISFKKHCENEEYKDISITWSSTEGLDIGKVKFIDAKLKSLDLTIDEEGNLQGAVGLNAALNEDKVIDDIIKIKKGINGDFSFHYSAGNNFNGYFKFGGIQGINLELLKENKRLAALNNGVLSDDGVLTGDIKAEPKVVTYSSEGIHITVDKLEANISYSLFAGLTLNSGHGLFTLKEIDGIDGKLQVALNINSDIFTTTIKSNNLSGYGFTFSKLNVSASMSREFEIEEIRGSFDVKHDDFDAAISIQEFIVSEGKLQKFEGNGAITYAGAKVNITSTSYDAESELIVIDANIEIEENGTKVAASVSDFTIDREGNITFEGYNVNVSSQLYFGPVTVVLKGDVNEDQKIDGNWRHYSADASFYLKMKTAKGIEKETAIAEAQVKFIKHKSQNLYREVAISIEGANIPVGEIYGVKSAVKDFNIKVVSDSEFSSDSDGGDGISISEESYITLKSSLTEDKQLHDLVTLKKGLEGDYKFNFSGGDNFEGSFDFEGIKKLNLLVEKNGQEIASLRNGSLDSSGKLSGKITALQGASYNSGGFEITVDKLELGVELLLTEEASSFKILNGQGKFTVENITGVEGTFKVGLTYDKDGNFSAAFLSKESTLTAFGMTLQDLNLNARFTSGLELQKLDGSLSASHAELDGELAVSKFEVENGELKVWKATGFVNYKGFNFDLTKSSYQQEKLSITASVEIDDAGKLAVDRFVIDKDGAISIGKISGGLEKPMVEMTFNATFKDNGFEGDFKGDVKFIGVDGAIAFGTQPDFTYGYLSLTTRSKQGIPLGPTGLQLTTVGGQLGYNYYLDYTSSGFTGSPRQHNYLIGLTLGISDVTNMFSAEGTSVVQFGEDEFKLTLLGSVKAPRSSPMIETNFAVNYHLPDNTLDGTMDLDVSIPPGSGLVFKTDPGTTGSFNYAENNWNVEASLSAKLFRLVNFQGNVDFRRQPTSIRAHVSGRAFYDFSYNLVMEKDWASFNAGIEAHFDSQVTATLDNSGFTGAIAVSCSGLAYLDFEVFGYDVDRMEVGASGSAKLQYVNGQGNLEGSLRSSFSFFSINREVQFPVNVNF